MHTHSDQPLKEAFLLTTIILVVEAAAGAFSHSLALLADAGHILTDVIALALAWFAVEQAKRPADTRRTYGYHRAGILTAMVNGAALVAIVAAVAIEALHRLSQPEPIQAPTVIVAAAIAIGVNAFITLRLRDHEHDSLNVRAALLHVTGDLAASFGVIAAGAVILLTGWLYADPIISLAIAALIAWGAVRLVLETGNILMEGVPKGLDLGAISATISETNGVDSFHDLHVWAIAPSEVALSCHVIVSDERLAEGEHVMRHIEQALCEQFGIGHTTIQVEACHQCEVPAGHLAGEHNHPHG